MITTIGNDIDKAVSLLQQNEIVAIPTETVYGLAGNALSEMAIAKIYEAKGRPRFNPLIMHVANVEAIEMYAETNEEVRKLINAFMPGPLTILLKKRSTVPDLLTAGSDKVAIRIPAHPVAHELLSKLDFPLAAPSANPFGYISPVTAQHVFEGLNGKINYILDGGTTSIGLESTIIEMTDDKIFVHRLGGTSIESIKEKTALPVIISNKKEKPETAGQLKSHYAPATPLFVGDVKKLISENAEKKMAVISLSKKYEGADNYTLSAANDLTEAASKLFSTLRKLDAGNYDLILAEVFPTESLGAAINDRLNRAQAIYKK
jgi:L-threonylcarbamoyladenylate synthase